MVTVSWHADKNDVKWVSDIDNGKRLDGGRVVFRRIL